MDDSTGPAAYHKPTAGKAPHEGAVYTVAGSSGQASGGTLNHPAMFISLNLLGSMVLDVNDLRLDAKFIDNTGTVRDYFTIEKGSTAPPLAITTPTLPGGTVGVAYSQSLAATGGTTPYTWSIVGGTLPAGLALNASNGLISGTPTTPGASSFTAQVVDSASPQGSAQKGFSIAVVGALPGAFNKSSPKNNAKNQLTSLTLSWAASSGSTSYEYCVDTTNDNACAGTWISTGSTRSAAISGLATKKAHYWQVRARNASGTTLANGGTWWKFTTR